MTPLVNTAVQLGLIVMIILLMPATYRVVIGPHPSDRLQAIDTITTLLIGIIVLLGLLQGSALVIDVGIALAAFGFIGTLAVARYLSEGKVF
ncbi:MAG: pH regulation protein F [Anaerolineae bacterium]|nr:pH regulation protein F [Anaerolineae bacterium]